MTAIETLVYSYVKLYSIVKQALFFFPLRENSKMCQGFFFFVIVEILSEQTVDQLKVQLEAFTVMVVIKEGGRQHV